MKLYKNKTTGEEELWTLSTKLQKIINQSIKSDEWNYRIMKAPVKEVINGTICWKRTHTCRYKFNKSHDL